jgi:phosphatidylglycerophosphate synthase
VTGIGWQLPDASLRTSAALAVGFSCLGTIVIGVTARVWIEAGGFYPMKAAAVCAAVMAIAVGGINGHHPFRRFGPANSVTTIRLMQTSLVAGLIGEPQTRDVAWFAVAAAVFMAALDGVDGWLARRSRMASTFGARFDMETDALLIMVLSVLVWQHHKAGAWVLMSGLMRYAFVAAGWLLPSLTRPLHPSGRRKTIAVGQLIGLTVALAPVVPWPLSSLVAVLALTALAWSFALDVVWLLRAR